MKINGIDVDGPAWARSGIDNLSEIFTNPGARVIQPEGQERQLPRPESATGSGYNLESRERQAPRSESAARGGYNQAVSAITLGSVECFVGDLEQICGLEVIR